LPRRTIRSRSAISSGAHSSLARANSPDGSAFSASGFGPERILDIGCGAGIPLTLALSETFDVTGVDVSTRQIELARKNVPAARFIHGDVTTSDFAVASFDAAVASYSLIHVPRGEHVGLFRSIARWLSTDGVCSRTSEWAIRKLTPMKIGSARRSFGAVLMLMESVPH
jgi:SAM-dependent methyltransferase